MTCKTCGKPNHPTPKCKFNCADCATNGVYHSKTYDCPAADGKPKAATRTKAAPKVRSKTTTAPKAKTATKCTTCGKPHPTAKCRYNCQDCAANGVYHSTTYDCPDPNAAPRAKAAPKKTAAKASAKKSSPKRKTPKSKISPGAELLVALIQEVENKIESIDEEFANDDVDFVDCSTCVVDLGYETCVCEYRVLLDALETARDDELL
jgi:hypothetical protein